MEELAKLTELKSRLAGYGLALRSDLTGAKLTTYSVGGALSSLLEVSSVEQIQSALRVIADIGIEYRVLGGGSNLIIPDRGVDLPVIRLGPNFKFIEKLSSEQGYERVRVGGAVALMSLVRYLSDDGLSGLEFAGGIPAQIGGAVWMNAGAHGGEIFSRLESIALVDAHGEYIQITPAELSFSYRRSGLPKGAIVLSAILRLVSGDVERSRELRAHLLAERKARQPLTYPSAGSVFKNPSIDRTAGWLIEQCGLKGYQIGGAQISQMHGNWIVNLDRKAQADDIMSLIKIAKEQVKSRFDIELENEQIVW